MWQKTKNIYHLMVAILANIIYRFPGRKLTIIGVTGTDGKTTTVNLIYHILKTAGKPVSMISTVGANLEGESSLLENHVTTPSSFVIQKFLYAALQRSKKDENQYVVLEVSSHALDQNRAWGVPFVAAVLTNVTNEHLDYHGTYDKYLRAKEKLLRKAKAVVINKDDRSYALLHHRLEKETQSFVTYGFDRTADINPTTFPFKTKLIGDFNKYNILAAVSVCKSLGVNDEDIRKGIETFQLPIGRLDEIKNDKGLHIYIDFAHTPNGLEQAIEALRAVCVKDAKIISLTGAEGYRDPRKRPLLGEIAARLSDIVIITAVDPRGLSDEINEEILQGVKKAGGIIGKNVFIENDREKAIDFAINTLAKKGDIVGIFGKGHERSMNMDGKHEMEWSDYKAVEKALQ